MSKRKASVLDLVPAKAHKAPRLGDSIEFLFFAMGFSFLPAQNFFLMALLSRKHRTYYDTHVVPKVSRVSNLGFFWNHYTATYNTTIVKKIMDVVDSNWDNVFSIAITATIPQRSIRVGKTVFFVNPSVVEKVTFRISVIDKQTIVYYNNKDVLIRIVGSNKQVASENLSWAQVADVINQCCAPGFCINMTYRPKNWDCGNMSQITLN